MGPVKMAWVKKTNGKDVDGFYGIVTFDGEELSSKLLSISGEGPLVSRVQERIKSGDLKTYEDFMFRYLNGSFTRDFLIPIEEDGSDGT